MRTLLPILCLTLGFTACTNKPTTPKEEAEMDAYMQYQNEQDQQDAYMEDDPLLQDDLAAEDLAPLGE